MWISNLWRTALLSLRGGLLGPVTLGAHAYSGPRFLVERKRTPACDKNWPSTSMCQRDRGNIEYATTKSGSQIYRARQAASYGDITQSQRNTTWGHETGIKCMAFSIPQSLCWLDRGEDARCGRGNPLGICQCLGASTTCVWTVEKLARSCQKKSHNNYHKTLNYNIRI